MSAWIGILFGMAAFVALVIGVITVAVLGFVGTVVAALVGSLFERRAG